MKKQSLIKALKELLVSLGIIDRSGAAQLVFI